ncbi:MAG: hypothetical protein EAX96_09680 [Candidatus Lokiarchaeota archaeon]|nr:hypothetical protein [Candidatus Lokiarchaeota archaeon]
MGKKDKNSTIIQSELYELNLPGELILKEVMDGSAKRIGVVRCVRVSFPTKVELIIKGLDVEIPINFNDIINIGTVIQLKSKIKVAEECDVNEVVRLRSEIQQEVKELYNG